MGRSSRITRTFHNKPRSNTTVKSTTKITTPQTTKHVSGSSNRSEEPQRQYNTPQAHAQEEQNVSKTVYKAKSKAKAIKQQRDWHSPLTLFASGVGNQAHDIGGSVHGLVTGQDYQVKSVLNRAAEHAFAGDWDSAGRVISDNPYRFAGNVATEVGLAIIPFGMVARGAGIAGKVGSAVARSGKGKTIAMKAIRAEEKRTGTKFTRSQIRNILDDTPTVKDVQKKTLSEVAKGDTNYSYWSKATGKQNVHGKNWNQMTSKERVKERSLDLSYSNYVKKSDSGFSGNAFSRSNIGKNIPTERRFDTTIKTPKISRHNQAKLPDQVFFQKGLPGSVIPSDLVKPGTFYTQPARWNPNRGAVFRVSDRQKIGGPKGTGSFKDLRGTTSSDNQHMSQFSKYPVPNSVVKTFTKDGKVKRPSDGKTIKSLVWYEGQFTPKNPYVPGV